MWKNKETVRVNNLKHETTWEESNQQQSSNLKVEKLNQQQWLHRKVGKIEG